MVRLAIDRGLQPRRWQMVLVGRRRAGRHRRRARRLQLPAGLPRRARLAGRGLRPARRALRAHPAPQLQLLRPGADRAAAHAPDQRRRAGAHLRRLGRHPARRVGDDAARLRGAALPHQPRAGRRGARHHPAHLLRAQDLRDARGPAVRQGADDARAGSTACCRRICRGCAWCAPSPARRARRRATSEINRELRDLNLDVITRHQQQLPVRQPVRQPRHHRRRRLRRPAGVPPPPDPRRADRVQQLPRLSAHADHDDRLSGGDDLARRRLGAARVRAARRAARGHRRARRARRCRRWSGASSSRTCASATPAASARSCAACRFAVEPGQMVALLGTTGAGKSHDHQPDPALLRRHRRRTCSSTARTCAR